MAPGAGKSGKRRTGGLSWLDWSLTAAYPAAARRGDPPGERGTPAGEVMVADERRGISCGVEGCLFLAMALFAILMVAMLIIVLIRFGSPP